MHDRFSKETDEKSRRDEESAMNPGESLLSLKDLCGMLSISAATGRNWLKSGKLVSQVQIKRKVYFSAEYAASLKNALENGTDPSLKSRRNKKYVSGARLYRSYVSEGSSAPAYVQSILNYMEINGIKAGETELRTLAAECAVRLLKGKTLPADATHCLLDYFQGRLDLNGYEFLIDDLIGGREASLTLMQRHPGLFAISCPHEKNEDLLGLLYLSVKNSGTRKITGSYYTPTRVVQKLCRKLFEDEKDTANLKNSTGQFPSLAEADPENYNASLFIHQWGKKILDPCCGTGNFLLQLPGGIPFSDVYGNDTDLFSVKLARINLALKYSVKDPALLYEHVTNENYLTHSFPEKFNFIIGNPPWGYDFTESEKIWLRKNYSAAAGSGPESYDLFIEKALRDLAPHGQLSFVLPEALINVRSHEPIRKLLLENCRFRYLEFLGSAFDGVQCPSVILQAEYTGKRESTAGLEVKEEDRSFRVNADRDISPECFPFHMTDEEDKILEKLRSGENRCFLAGNAAFALGIVTGNNKKYLSDMKTGSNEVVLKGADLKKYRYQPSSNYLVFQPEAFQQTAPEEYYRAPEKLFYRFISSQLVFAYDDRQTLSLNSCNLVIPKIPGLSMKYILAVLNSRMAQFYFEKAFRSVKVLRSHIEQIPIPKVPEAQQEGILKDVEILLSDRSDEIRKETYDRLDEEIAKLYGLTDEEYSAVRAALEKENLFL